MPAKIIIKKVMVSAPDESLLSLSSFSKPCELAKVSKDRFPEYEYRE